MVNGVGWLFPVCMVACTRLGMMQVYLTGKDLPKVG